MAAIADANIFITQTAGDLPLLRAESFMADASVSSLTGDVSLVNQSGSILDGDRESFLPRKKQPINFVQQKFIDQGVASGLFSAQSVAQPLTGSLMKFLNPGAAIPNVVAPPSERLNIKGRNVSLTAASPVRT